MAKGERKHKKLCEAVVDGDLETARKQLSKGLDPDLFPFNWHQDSILMVAIKNQAEFPMIELLVEHGASPDYKNRHEQTALDTANNYLRMDVVDLLEARGVDTKWVDLKDLPQATRDARLTTIIDDDWTAAETPKLVKRLLEAGANPLTLMGEMPAPFELIRVSSSNGELFAALLEGVDPQIRHEGRTLLHALSEQASKVEIGQLFVDLGVPLDAQDNDGNTALHLAVQAGYWDAPRYIEWLVGIGANSEVRNSEGETCSDIASGDRKKLLMQLAGHGLDEDAVVLMAAVDEGDVEKVQELLQIGASFHAIDTSETSYRRGSLTGISALHLAFADSKRYPVAELLLAQPTMNPNARSLSGQTPLHVLTNSGDGDRLELIKQLIALGADPNAANERGRSPLFGLESFYQLSDEIELLDLMVKLGADVNLLARGETLLDQIFDEQRYFHEKNDRKGFCQYVERLVEHGAKAGANSQEQVSAWLHEKFALFLDGKKPEVVESPIRSAFEGVVGKSLSELMHEETWLEIEGGYEPVVLFDWFALVDEEERDEGNDASTIDEHHVMGAPEEFVPFGVVGLSEPHFAEISTDGTLFLVAPKANDGDAPVVFIPNQSTIARLTENDDPRPLEVGFKALLGTRRDAEPT